MFTTLLERTHYTLGSGLNERLGRQLKKLQLELVAEIKSNHFLLQVGALSPRCAQVHQEVDGTAEEKPDPCLPVSSGGHRSPGHAFPSYGRQRQPLQLPQAHRDLQVFLKVDQVATCRTRSSLPGPAQLQDTPKRGSPGSHDSGGSPRTAPFFALC